MSSVPDDLLGRWYVAHTRSRHEKALANELLRLGVFSYLPLAEHITRSPRTHRATRSLIPVFPGYVFFNGSEEQRYLALTTNRVANVLNVPNQLQLVRELQQVQRLLQTGQDFLVSEVVNIGDWGRIVAGPLAGLEGMVVRRSGPVRLALNVTILGQSVTVEVDREVVEPIAPPDCHDRAAPLNRGSD